MSGDFWAVYLHMFENCYATGAVSGNESVGGLVGLGWSSYAIIKFS